MTRTKDKSEIEHIRAENRKLTKENKMLRRDIARLSKRSQDIEELEEQLKEHSSEEEHIYIDPTQCKSCLKGKITTTSLGIRIIKTCNGCTYREVTKN